jgi:hypothetical protein
MPRGANGFHGASLAGAAYPPHTQFRSAWTASLFSVNARNATHYAKVPLAKSESPDSFTRTVEDRQSASTLSHWIGSFSRNALICKASKSQLYRTSTSIDDRRTGRSPARVVVEDTPDGPDNGQALRLTSA